MSKVGRACNELVDRQWGGSPDLRYFPVFAGFAEKNEIAGHNDADTLVEWRDFASGCRGKSARRRLLA
jgi:hypothetical protein